MKRLLTTLTITILTILTITGAAFAAGSCTFTTDTTSPSREMSWLCTSDGDGAVNAPTVTGTGYNKVISGVILRAEIIPGSSTVQPTTGFAVYLNPFTAGTTPDTTVDFLHALTTSCSNSASTIKDIYDGLIVPVPARKIIPRATGLGDANQFTLKVWVVE